jgi:hypothetical protein
LPRAAEDIRPEDCNLSTSARVSESRWQRSHTDFIADPSKNDEFDEALQFLHAGENEGKRVMVTLYRLASESYHQLPLLTIYTSTKPGAEDEGRARMDPSHN